MTEQLPGKPPLARREDIVELLHGVEVADPYRWLEDQESAETRAWVEAQDAHTCALLAQTPQRAEIQQRLTELARIDSIGLPTIRPDAYFFSKRRAEDELPIFYRRPRQNSHLSNIGSENVSHASNDGATNAGDEVLLDPHTLSEDGSVSISVMSISRDGTLVVYGVRHGGEDEVEIHILDVASRTDLPERLPRARYMGIALTPDNSTLYYSRETDDGPRVYRYRRSPENAALQEPEEIFGAQYEKGKYISPGISDDGRYLLYTVFYGAGSSLTDLYIQLLPTAFETSDGIASHPIVPLITGVEARFYGEIVALPETGDRLYLQTNLEAPNDRIMAVDLDRLDMTRPTDTPLALSHLVEIIPTRADAVLEGCSMTGGHLIANYLQDVRSRIEIFDPQGKFVREIALPSLGSAGGPYGEWDRSEAFYTFTSFAYPTVIYRYDMETGVSEEWACLDVPIDPSQLEVRQIFYTSKDGTRVPMFIMHRKGLMLDGTNPTLLYGYGGFTASLTPGFSSFATLWAEKGGVYALANLRGGGEYGEAWHQAGMRDNKQNTFDDFYAAAEYLIAQRYTNPDKLATMGGSNGGLLVGAGLTQRPELCRAVICAVPLLDMVRYHQFLVARYWIPEYGSSDDPDQFRTLYAYSPYHHVVPGTRYPAVLFVTGDADTRVAPLHARKMAALLQAANADASVTWSDERPILLRYDTKSGHMGTKPLYKVIEDSTDQLCFLFGQLGV